ncbi:hypothetical protein FRB99_003731 [Tulasnella sp. 403]|nr:hypothetical protein FRB99_003731 [Tulasnella sp. 403]
MHIRTVTAVLTFLIAVSARPPTIRNTATECLLQTSCPDQLQTTTNALPTNDMEAGHDIEPVGTEQHTIAIGQGFLDSYQLFPYPVLRGFTTLPSTSGMRSSLVHVGLSDKPLGVTKVSAGTTHNIIDNVPQSLLGTKAWKAVYPEGSIHPGSLPRGGFGFYLAGPRESGFDFSSATDVLFSYAVYFEPEFDFKWAISLVTTNGPVY